MSESHKNGKAIAAAVITNETTVSELKHIPFLIKTEYNFELFIY